MTRDYARRNTTRKKPKKKPLYPWLMFLLLSILIVYGLLNLSKYQRYIHDLAKTTLEKKTPKNIKKETIQETPDVEPQPIVPTPTITKTATIQKFDFYNILPQKKTNTIETSYELEVAVVKDFAAADKLKAELSLLGFTVNVSPIHRQGTTKYNISVGPYDNKDGATIDQQKLKHNNIRSTIKKM